MGWLRIAWLYFKMLSNWTGWLGGLGLFLVCLTNGDLPYSGWGMLAGIVIWWLGASIGWSLRRELEAKETKY